MEGHSSHVILGIESAEGADVDGEELERFVGTIRRELREVGADVTNMPGEAPPEGARAVAGTTLQLMLEIPPGIIGGLVAEAIFRRYDAWRRRGVKLRVQKPDGEDLDLSSATALEKDLRNEPPQSAGA
jgi:hypothetical protein